MPKSLLLDKAFIFNDVFVNFEDQTLSFGNDLFVRQLDLSEVIPRTKSFVYLPLNKELTWEQELFDFSFIGYNFPGGHAKVEFELIDINICVVPSSWRDGEHVKIDIRIKENVQRLEGSSQKYVPKYKNYRLSVKL